MSQKWSGYLDKFVLRSILFWHNICVWFHQLMVLAWTIISRMREIATYKKQRNIRGGRDDTWRWLWFFPEKKFCSAGINKKKFVFTPSSKRFKFIETNDQDVNVKKHNLHIFRMKCFGTVTWTIFRFELVHFLPLCQFKIKSLFIQVRNEKERFWLRAKKDCSGVKIHNLPLSIMWSSHNT